MGQEKKSEAEICTFVKKKYQAKFPLFSKIEVNGPDTHDVYKYLRYNSELHDAKTGKSKEIPWNFAKFVVDKEGHVVKYFAPTQKVSETEDLVRSML